MMGCNASDNRGPHVPPNVALTLTSGQVQLDHNKRLRGHNAEPRSVSDLRPLGQSKRILDIHAEIANSVLDLRMAEQNLHCSQVARRLVDYRRLSPPQ